MNRARAAATALASASPSAVAGPQSRCGLTGIPRCSRTTSRRSLIANACLFTHLGFPHLKLTMVKLQDIF